MATTDAEDVQTATAKVHQFSIEMHTTAPVDSESGYRLKNEPNELQRPNVIDRTRGELSLVSDLTHVVHGTLTPGGAPATLMAFTFNFNGSQIQGRRFKDVIINIGFAHGNSPKTTVGSSPFDPEVLQISPDGEFCWNHTSVTGETMKGITLSTGGLGGPMLAAMGFAPELAVNWESITPTTHEGQATMYGARKVMGRNTGSKNSGRWIVRENKLRRSGVPAQVTTAILVKPHPRSGGVFRAVVEVDAQVNVAFKIDEVAKRMVGKSIVDPVVFKHGLGPVGPVIKGLDVTNLGSVGEKGILKRLGFVKVRLCGYTSVLVQYTGLR